jgi:NADPH:quinone reductase-like Zn-dependent oxidoreductase
MRAWTFSTRGTPSNILTWTSSLPTPILTPSQILIRISHAALNPGGTTAMALMPTILRVKNSIPEIDFAGTVVARGAFAPSHLTIGTRVFGAIHLKSMNRGMGTLADYIAIGETDGGVAVLPDRVSFEQGAGLAGCGITGLGMWREAGCQEGDRVLVNGASGGAGTMAVQVAKALGTGKVVGICSGRNAEMVRGLGADEVSGAWIVSGCLDTYGV